MGCVGRKDGPVGRVRQQLELRRTIGGDPRGLVVVLASEERDLRWLILVLVSL